MSLFRGRLCLQSYIRKQITGNVKGVELMGLRFRLSLGAAGLSAALLSRTDNAGAWCRA